MALKFKNKIMIILEIKDPNEIIQIGQCNSEDFHTINSAQIICQITGTELLDAIAFWKNTLLEMDGE